VLKGKTFPQKAPARILLRIIWPHLAKDEEAPINAMD